ncbi:CRP-like cAMP-binding protein [Nitrobacteraceae bacterium AZCC 2161]
MSSLMHADGRPLAEFPAEMNEQNHYTSGNVLLRQLPANEDAMIGRAAQNVTLRQNERLIEKDKPMAHVYFLDQGWASVISMGGVRPVEVAMVGSEGLVGISVILGADHAVNNCIMQTVGSGLRIAASEFQSILSQMPVLRRRIHLHVHDRLLQSYEAIVASTVGSLEARVSRAILMCHDRSQSDNIAITQEQLARKVGANRAGVTTALHVLEGHKIIQSKRRCVLVLDRSRLENAAAGTYARATAE